MCWRSDNCYEFEGTRTEIERDRISVAADDIRVFKVVYAEPGGTFRSYFRDSFEWTLGKRTMKVRLPREAAKLERGYHSYSPECPCSARDRHGNYVIKLRPWSGVREDVQKSPGIAGIRVELLDVADAVPMLKSYACGVTPLAMLECVIPAGTRYYANSRGEYVSETLTPVGIAGIVGVTEK